MASIQPIPQDKISETLKWRDWFKNVYDRISALGTMSTQNTGASGTFKSADATPKTITVVNGVITSIV
jgi:hypothetical protein